MKTYKYIHIFYKDETKFNPRIVELINEKSNGFIPEEHLFVTQYKTVYDKISQYSNTYYVERDKKRDPSIINECAERGNWIIVHSMPSIQDCLKIKDKYCSKIIWRTWGHDVTYTYYKGQFIKNTLKHIVEYFWKRKVRKFYAIGIANIVDQVDIRKQFGNVRCYRLPYAQKRDENKILSLKKACTKKNRDTLNILLGHSGYCNDNHIEILKKLNKYKNKKIKIFLIFSYGNEEYMKIVKEYIEEFWADKVIVISEFMKYEDYVEFLSNIDIAILDGEKSYALGNISLLLYFSKKLFVNRNGLIREVFDLINVPYSCTDEVGQMSFEDFSKPLDFSNVGNELSIHTYQENITQWHILLNDLDNCRYYRKN